MPKTGGGEEVSPSLMPGGNSGRRTGQLGVDTTARVGIFLAASNGEKRPYIRVSQLLGCATISVLFCTYVLDLTSLKKPDTPARAAALTHAHTCQRHRYL